MPWCLSPGASCLRYWCRTPNLGRDQQVRPTDQLKAIEMLLDRGLGRSPQQLYIAHSASNRPLGHLAYETLRLLVENG